jgi:hypothetical protein
MAVVLSAAISVLFTLYVESKTMEFSKTGIDECVVEVAG